MGTSADADAAAAGPKSWAWSVVHGRKSDDPKVQSAIAKLSLWDAVSKDLSSGDADRQGAAVAILRDPKLITPPNWNRSTLWAAWQEPLLDMKQYDLLAELCDRALLGDCSATWSVAGFTMCRTRALMAAGKFDEALSSAKSYYNCCPLEKTSEAIGLVSEVLVNSRGKTEAGVVRRFRQQQQFLAQSPPALDGPPLALPPELGENLLTPVKVDSSRYQAALAAAAKGTVSYKSLTAQGNLLLAADRPKDALAAFQSASDLAGDKQLSEAIANIARAMRAQDGSVGRANAYILSLRKSAPAAPAKKGTAAQP